MAKGMRRNREPVARWRQIIRRHGRSGLTIREFCRKSKLHESAFYFWRRELQRRDTEQEQRQTDEPATTPAFVAVRVGEQSSVPAGGHIEIELPCGRRVHVAAPVDRQALADVLAVLRFDEFAAPSRAEREGRPC